MAVMVLLTIAGMAQAKYSGGKGEPNDPYQIASAADLIALGETPEDYDKHFILTADIDLDPNLPGRKVFDRAVIASHQESNDPWSDFQGTPFSDVFDGDAHRILHLTAAVEDGVGGLFGVLVGEVKDLGVVDVNVNNPQTMDSVYNFGGVGGLVGWNYGGSVVRCFSTGRVRDIGTTFAWDKGWSGL